MKKRTNTTSILLRVFFVIFVASAIGLGWQKLETYKTEVKAIGGHFKEGIIGSPRFINPVLAQSQADHDLSNIIFTPLVSIDRDGSVHYKAADSIDILNDGLLYRVVLRNDILFHDETPLTTEDVYYTISAIQDPLIKSPLAQQWEGIEMEIVDPYTIDFTLARPFHDFLYNLEVGILPKHIWENVNSQEFVFSIYNTKPIGSGPYKIKNVIQKNNGTLFSYQLQRSDVYFEKNYIQEIDFIFFDDEEGIVKGLEDGTIDAAYGLSPENIQSVIEKNKMYTGSLPRIFALFLNQKNQPLFESKILREVIRMSINKQSLVENIFSGFATPINSALGFKEEVEIFDIQKATLLIESEGWRKNETGIYEKNINGTLTELEFSIALPNLEEMIAIVEDIQSDLATVGIRVIIRSYDQGNLSQNIIRNRDYESLLFGYEIKKPSDLYAFWHSSQISDPGLNISLFENQRVDNELERLRTTSPNNFNIIDTSINEEVPAIFLYSPSYIYLLPTTITNNNISIVSSEDRFNNIENWFIETRSVWNLFIKN